MSVGCSGNDYAGFDCFVAGMVVVVGPRRRDIQAVGSSAVGMLAEERSVVGPRAVVFADIAVERGLVVVLAAALRWRVLQQDWVRRLIEVGLENFGYFGESVGSVTLMQEASAALDHLKTQ